MTSQELNAKLAELCDNESYTVQGLEGTDKCIPYIGWFWRVVDFDAETCRLGDCGQFVGFMQKNKWGYDELVVGGEAWAELKRLLQVAADSPSGESLQDVFDYMQGLRGGQT